MKQGGKLLQRDARLSNEREMMLSLIGKSLKKHDYVIAYFYGGSIGTKKTDLYSDIDLRIIVQPAFYQVMLDEKKELVSKFGKVLFMEHPQADLPYLTAHYENFMKLDLHIYRPQDLQPSIWTKNIEIAYDPYGLMSHVNQTSKSYVFALKGDVLEQWRTSFFANYHDLYRSVMRNELYQGMHIIDKMRWLIVSGWMMEKGIIPNNYLDWSKIEGKRSPLSPTQLETLLNWEVSRDAEMMKEISRQMAHEFKILDLSLSKKAGVSHNASHLNKVFSLVNE